MCFFGFSTQKPKNTVQNQKKPKIQSKPKDSLPDFGFLVFWFRVVLLSRKIVGSRLPKQMAVYVGVVIGKKKVSLLRALKCAKTQIILRF